MSVREHKKRSHAAVRFAVLTISDSRTKENDESGRLITSLLLKNGHIPSQHVVLPDEKAKIVASVKRFLRRDDVEAVIINGGTGISKRDVTWEALNSLYEKTLDGFGELFRWLSYGEIRSAAIMSRASAGICRGKVVFSIPGSPDAVRLAMKKIILPEIAHILYELQK